MRTEPHVVAGEELPVGATFDVVDPWSGEVVARAAEGGAVEVDAAVAAAKGALSEPLPAHERARLCDAVAAAVRADAEAFAQDVCTESGKPIKTARAEVERCVSTFVFAAVEARSLAGEVVPMDAAVAGEGKTAFTIREPKGVVAAITPFNFPLNLVAHKLAPALAAGCPVVLKPAEKTPLSGARLARIMRQVGVPPAMINVVHGTGPDVAVPLVGHPDVAVVSFTGSTAVGHAIERDAAGKTVLLELGSNAALLVEPDADLDRVVAKVAATGFAHAGQSCVSVQRLLVADAVHDELLARLVPAVEALVLGDPHDDATDVGPLIRADQAEKVLGWVEEAVAAGARVVTGGHAKDALMEPTVVADATRDMALVCSEAFAPVVVVLRYRDLDEGIAMANDSAFGLNVAVFTRDLGAALTAARALRAGAVLVNESPTWRTDQMPYGGVGESGNTREGPRWSVREMTREKLVVLQA